MINHFAHVPGEKGNGRFLYLANLLAEQGNVVELVTSDFSHFTKSKRALSNNLSDLSYNITFIKEPVYQRNVSLKRYYSHYIMSKNLSKYLNTIKNPDVVYCSVPSLSVANVTVRYTQENNIPLVIDIQDLWPEAFEMILPFMKLSKLMLSPLRRNAENIYSKADRIVAVSDTYARRAACVNNRIDRGLNVYLGTDIHYFDSIAERSKIEKPNNEFWIIYIGTLGSSYDIPSVMDALELLDNKGIKNIVFKVLGDGPLKNKFMKYIQGKNIRVDFTGLLDYEMMVHYLVASDVAVNPIVKGSAASIINKVGDYAAAGLPVLNTQECMEYQELVESYNSGFNCKNGNVEDLACKILELYKDEDKRTMMGNNNRRLAIEKFDREKTYQAIIKLIGDIV